MTTPEKLTHANLAAAAALRNRLDNDYYASLIDWDNPEDPIRKLASSGPDGVGDLSRWDAPSLNKQGAVPGLHHVYGTNACLNISPEWSRDPLDLQQGLQYIASHPEINQVLLSGEDALALEEGALDSVLAQLRAIEHVRIIRLGSQLPVRNPGSIYGNSALLERIRTHSTAERRIYMTVHINHPREITDEAKLAFEALQQAGAILVNRTHVLQGVNDDAAVLAELLDRLVWGGVAPYYFFIQAPSDQNRAFVLPLARAYQLVEEAKARTTGLGKRVRLSMSHATGMVEILAIEHGKAYMKHYPTIDGQQGQFLMADCPPDAVWLDKLPQAGAGTEPEQDEHWSKPVPDLEIEIDLTPRVKDVASVNIMPIGD